MGKTKAELIEAIDDAKMALEEVTDDADRRKREIEALEAELDEMQDDDELDAEGEVDDEDPQSA